MESTSMRSEGATNATTCENCGFELTTLPMTLPQKHVGKRQSNHGIEIFCPVCGAPYGDLMQGLGFFPRQTLDADGNVLAVRWRYWSDTAQPVRTGAIGPQPVPIGQFKIQFGEEAEPIRWGDITFQKVPRFVHQRGSETKTIFPTLPVKPEFLDCLDPRALREIREGKQSFRPRITEKNGTRVFECVLPLRGRLEKDWKPCQIPIGDEIEGVFLRHWPNIDDYRWRFHLISLGFEGTKGRSARKLPWRVKALVPQAHVDHGPRQDQWEDESALYSYALPSPNADDDPAVYSLAIEPRSRQSKGPAGSSEDPTSAGPEELHRGRPAWIAVDLSRSGVESLGGVFAIPPGKKLAERPFEFGLDFGTSNTVYAFSDSNGPPDTVSPSEESTRWLFGYTDPRNDPDELWPGVSWAGQHRDLLPSELMLRAGSWHEYESKTEQISELKLGVQVGVPLMMAHPTRDLGSGPSKTLGLIADFKWQRALKQQRFPMIGDQAWRLQAKFLEGRHHDGAGELHPADGVVSQQVADCLQLSSCLRRPRSQHTQRRTGGQPFQHTDHGRAVLRGRATDPAYPGCCEPAGY